MGMDRRLKTRHKNQMDNDPYSQGSFKFGSFLAKLQGVNEEFIGARAATIGGSKSAITTLSLGILQAAYIANDAAVEPSFSGAGIAITTNTAENDGVLVYSDSEFQLPEASLGDKIVFESLLNLTTVANCDEAGFIISNASSDSLDVDTSFLASDTYIGVNINEGKVEIVYDLNTSGSAIKRDTGLRIVDGEDIHVKIEISAARKASIYINGSLIKAIEAVTFDVDDTLRPVFGALVDASAVLGTINIKELSIYKVLA